MECLLAVDAINSISCNAGDAFQQLQEFHERTNDWIFGHFAYDLKNEIEDLQSSNPDHIGFADLFFFQPRVVIKLSEHKIEIGAAPGQAQKIFLEIFATSVEAMTGSIKTELTITPRISRKNYLDTIDKLRHHILRGDCYEINYCQEFYGEDIDIIPLEVYRRLSTLSPNPFSAFYRVDQRYCICASPERFLKKDGNHLVSQPIKGTGKRTGDQSADEAIAGKLLTSEKEKAENVMIVDLVRNDLSRVCEEGSVKVDELFGLYSFPNLFQMISTVSGTLEKHLNSFDAIKALFPMGSMTGAPKKRVMELIEKYEQSRRGLFSGAIGYIDPKSNFDFNVVIRSVLYNSATRYLSYHTGSAITFASNPEEEYEECLLKGEAIKKVLEFSSTS